MTMTAVQVQTDVPLSELLIGVQQLDSSSLEQFADEVMLLRAKRRVRNLSRNEASLLRQINRGLSTTKQVRFDELKSKRQDETLTEDEHDELLALVDKIEERDVERLQALTKLAQLRNISVPSLMEDLGIIGADDA